MYSNLYDRQICITDKLVLSLGLSAKVLCDEKNDMDVKCFGEFGTIICNGKEEKKNHDKCKF